MEENKPIYRIDILNDIKENKAYQEQGLCKAISDSIGKRINSDVPYSVIHDIFPLFTRDNAKPFCKEYELAGYWWKPWIWNTGRMDFLNWLIEQYKYDKEDITELINTTIYNFKKIHYYVGNLSSTEA